MMFIISRSLSWTTWRRSREFVPANVLIFRRKFCDARFDVGTCNRCLLPIILDYGDYVLVARAMLMSNYYREDLTGATRGTRRSCKYDEPFHLFQDAADSTCSHNDNPYRAVCRSILYLCLLIVCVCLYIYIHIHIHVYMTYKCISIFLRVIYVYSTYTRSVHLLIIVNCYMCRT